MSGDHVRETTGRLMNGASSGRMRLLASLGLIAVYVAGVTLALSTIPLVQKQRELVVLLVEMLLRLPNSMANNFYWFALGVAGATAALAAGLALRSLLFLARREEDVRAADRLRVFAYLAIGATVLNVFVFSSPVAVNGPFRVQFPVLVQLLWTFVYGGYGLWTIRAIRRKPAVPGRFRRAARVLAINVVVALVAAELMLRLVATFVPIPILVTDESSSKIRRSAERLLAGTPRFGFPVNTGGHYDTEFLPRPERTLLTVASIGDSFSYGTVPHAYHYTTIIERERPEIEVYNLGFPAIGPRDYLYLLEGTALPLEPDLVLIQIFASNDFGDGAVWVDPPGWYDADYYLLGILWYRWQILSQAERSVSDGEVDGASQEALSAEERYPFLLDPTLETPSMSEELFSAVEVSRAQQIGTPNPVVEELFFDALGDLIAAASARGIPLAFVMIPDEFQVEDALWEHIVETSEVSLDRNLVLRNTVAWLEARDVPVLDLLPVFRAVEPLDDGHRHLYHLRDTHFNARGNEVAGIAMATFIEQVLADEPNHVAKPLPSNSASPQRVLPSGEMSSDEAAEILSRFGTLVTELNVNGRKVFDDSLLMHTKDEIMSAIVVTLNGDISAEQQAFAKEAARTLAFFQPGVVDAGVAIGSKRPDQSTWKNDVKAERQKINREINARTKNR